VELLEELDATDPLVELLDEPDPLDPLVALLEEPDPTDPLVGLLELAVPQPADAPVTHAKQAATAIQVVTVGQLHSRIASSSRSLHQVTGGHARPHVRSKMSFWARPFTRVRRELARMQTRSLGRGGARPTPTHRDMPEAAAD